MGNFFSAHGCTMATLLALTMSPPFSGVRLCPCTHAPALSSVGIHHLRHPGLHQDILGLSVSPKYQTNLCHVLGFGFRQRRLFRVCLVFPSVQVSLIFKLRGKATLNTSFFSGFQLRGSSCFRLPLDFRVSPPPSHIKCSDSSRLYGFCIRQNPTLRV